MAAGPQAETDLGVARFTTTHWSVILAAAGPTSPISALALETLCRTYWYPLYAFVRRQGFSPEDAQDLTQEFISRLLSTRALDKVAPAKGRFRSFLLQSLNHFLANERDRLHAKKRGGGRPLASLEDAETRFSAAPADALSADILFEREWALALLARTSSRLRGHYESGGKGPTFEALQIYLTGERGLPPYRQAAEQLGLTVGAIKKAVERLRRRYGELLRDEIGQTVRSTAEVDDEIRFLRKVLGGV